MSLLEDVSTPQVKDSQPVVKRPKHFTFVAGMFLFTFAILVGLFFLVRDTATPDSYAGLLGFPKVGTLPSKTDGDVIAFVFAFLVGFLIQRSRWCNASAIRDAVLFKSYRNTKPLLAAMMVITMMFTIFESINVGQPIRIVGGAFTVLGLFLFGIGMVLGGACTVSGWVRSAEGSVSSFVSLIYIFIGMFLFSELWNILRWPAASYLQTASPNLSILSFGSFNAMSIRGFFGSTWGPWAVMIAGSAQVALLAYIYKRLSKSEHRVGLGCGMPVRIGDRVGIGEMDSATAVNIFEHPSTNSAQPVVDPEGNYVQLANVGSVKIDRVLDCSGDMCPRPQLFTKKIITKEMDAGQVLELIVDNPSSPELIPTIMNDIGASHLGTVRSGTDWKLYIQKNSQKEGALTR